MSIKSTARLQACHGTQLTEEEYSAAEDAAWEVLGDMDHEYAYKQFLLKVDERDHDSDAAKLWREAESAAIDAAVEGWIECPEDLELTI